MTLAQILTALTAFVAFTLSFLTAGFVALSGAFMLTGLVALAWLARSAIRRTLALPPRGDA